MHRKNKLTRYNWADRVFLTVDFIVLFIFFLLIAYPLLFIISASFDSANSTLSASLIPRQFSLEGIGQCLNMNIYGSDTAIP